MLPNLAETRIDGRSSEGLAIYRRLNLSIFRHNDVLGAQLQIRRQLLAGLITLRVIRRGNRHSERRESVALSFSGH